MCTKTHSQINKKLISQVTKTIRASQRQSERHKTSYIYVKQMCAAYLRQKIYSSKSEGEEPAT
ncbi:hypothetical protein OIU74_011462 [Salix koriyanagi]|uniref:Uncharacterized protein n=1 Tax=Salix koriyanagi TaxID=2511006 RepID=A0A9Q0TFD7_9ROSI|nr:hypothetical protein OIU74_011462 [Salix koriyanagi]